MKLKEILSFFDQWAPNQLAEEYDNVGLLVGKPDQEINRILVSLDATENVVEEAISRNCDLIISHHPILFKGIKKLNGQNYVARCVEKAIKNGISLLAVHTNLDNVQTGVNHRIAMKLGLEKPRILRPMKNQLQILTFFVPEVQKESVLVALHNAGAGNIGNYSHCSFSSQGQGRFLPQPGSNPFSGTIGKPEEADEIRIEMILPKYKASTVISALKASHPYEEVAYFISNLENVWQDSGAGMVGDLPEEIAFDDFIQRVKKEFSLSMIKFTRPIKEKVKRIALCGGSGFFLLPDAKASGADVYLTADIKYHEFFDAEDQIVLMDIGHFESEQFTSSLIIEKLSIQFPSIAVLLSEMKTNPVFYA